MSEIGGVTQLDGQPWPAEQVLALAPDEASKKAGLKVSTATWHDEGCSTTAVWGLAAGSGKNPYQTVVDLTGPAYKCSCPSRKFPCKHALGLLLRWSAGTVPAGDPPAFADGWLSQRAEKAEASASRAQQRSDRPPDPEAQAKRVAARHEKVAGGMLELDRWLSDQIRAGLASLHGKGYAPFEQLAARLVDAQCPGVASQVRALPAILVSGPGWPDRLLEEFALLRLLVRAHARLDELDAVNPPLAATVRAQIGFPVSKETVLATPAVADLWMCHQVIDTPLDNLTQRTTYLTGRDSGRIAVVLGFTPGTMTPEVVAVPGRALAADLHFYPGAGARRALVGVKRHTRVAESVPGVSVEAALGLVSQALALNPWARSLPVWVYGQPVPVGSGWVVLDSDGDSLPLVPGLPTGYLAASGGHSIDALLEWTPSGWRPLAATTFEGRLVTL